jgi:hypothetical protein
MLGESRDLVVSRNSGEEANTHGHACSPGENNFHGFNCYRDNNHQLYDDGTHRCWSVYYCLGVSGCGMTFASRC